MESEELNASEELQLQEVNRIIKDVKNIITDEEPTSIHFSVSVSKKVRQIIEKRFARLNFHFTAERNAVMVKSTY